MILKFHEFWTNVKPTLIESEIHLFSNVYIYAGTCDLVVEINGVRWLLDIKTSNSLHTSYELQLAAYAQAWNEDFAEKINRTGILWLKSSKRKANKEKMTGKGWEIVQPSRTIDENIEIFKTIRRLFDLENPKESPIFTEFRTSAKRKL